MSNSDVIQTLIQTYGGRSKPSRKGWNICCPFHDDTDPSCTVFYSGVFSCFSCAKSWGPRQGFAALGVPERILAESFPPNGTGRPLDMAALPDLERASSTPVKREALVGVESREPWPEGWRYREIESRWLTDPGSPLVRTFAPSLVRLWVERPSGRHVEPLPRLSLKVGDKEVYLRLSRSTQIKTFNSDGFDFNDPALVPFGLTSFQLPPRNRALVLVEGPYDLLRTCQNLLTLDRMLYDQIPVVALLGVSHWRAFKEKLQLRFASQLQGNLVLAFDNDKAGQELTRTVTEDVVRSGLLPEHRVRVLPFAAHDPGEVDVDHFAEALGRVFSDSSGDETSVRTGSYL